MTVYGMESRDEVANYFRQRPEKKLVKEEIRVNLNVAQLIALDPVVVRGGVVYNMDLTEIIPGVYKVSVS